ncbi:MAG: glycosyltransferase family 4 protein [Anaerolineales bacterium]|nr:glycosyltransferase family 4 protein [Anaerolineales bacterium]
MASRGHQLTVLTTQYDKILPKEENHKNVRIIRLPIIARINKGVLAPAFGLVSTRLVRDHDVVLLHLPQFDAAGVALRSRLIKRPAVILYHSDLLLPKGAINRFVNSVVNLMNYLAGLFAHRVVAYTEDFANHSAFLQRFAHKCSVILPNVQMPQATKAEIEDFRSLHNPQGFKVIGMATRFAAEKGVEVLLESLPIIQARFPQVKVLFAGQYEGVWGEDAYYQRLMPKIKRFEELGRWDFLGVLSMKQMAAFYPNLDVLVVPSLNSTETFGFVQIEAMMNGVPVVASNLPGVRQPVAMTSMGKVVTKNNPTALAEAVIDIFNRPEDYRGDPENVVKIFHPNKNAAAFEQLFESLLVEIK